MSQMMKTMLFVGAALATTATAMLLKPAPVGVTPDEQIGKPLFDEFTDPLVAKSMEVVKYDEELGQLKSFKVAQQADGLWVIPSHQSYPADAEERLRNAATMFVDLKAVNVLTEAEGEHPVYGVVAPNPDNLTAAGIGTLVRIQNGENKNVVELIIGKEVKDRPGQRFVRIPSRSQVYQVELDPSKLSTKFEDWIKTDLLEMNQFDVQDITVMDYSVELNRSAQGFLEVTRPDRRFAMTVHQDAGKWILDSFQENRGAGLEPASLASDEALNTERLNAMRDALNQLKIVDVERKPKGLGADLKVAESFAGDREGQMSLLQRGFYPVPVNGETELWSSNGELLLNTKDGVQYVLRFGEISGISADDNKEAEEDQSSVNRFMMVSARVNDAHFPPPDLQPLPEDTGAATNEDTDADADASNEDAGEPDQEEKADAEGEKDAADKAATIQKENQRKVDERNEKIEAARKKVADLNYRFSDWYYVISEDVFKKIHLRRSDVIKVSAEAAQKGFGLDALRALENEGLEPKPEISSDAPPAE